MTQPPVLPRNARSSIESTSTITSTCDVLGQDTAAQRSIPASVSQLSTTHAASGNQSLAPSLDVLAHSTGSHAASDPLNRGSAGLNEPQVNSSKTILSNVADTLRSSQLQNALGGYDLSEIADTLETNPAAAVKHAVGQAMVWAAFAEEGEEAAVLEAANDLRAIARSVILASDLPPNEQADALRHSIAEGRALLTYVVGGKSLPKLIQTFHHEPYFRVFDHYQYL